jgi:hypothetical protein
MAPLSLLSFGLRPGFLITGAALLESIRVVSARLRGKVTPRSRRREADLVEGDFSRGGRAKLEDVTSATLVFTRRVTGGDGAVGESLIVVRFDASGKTRVREYRSVPDDVASKPPRPDRY